jgi:hypothetical protein
MDLSLYRHPATEPRRDRLRIIRRGRHIAIRHRYPGRLQQRPSLVFM